MLISIFLLITCLTKYVTVFQFPNKESYMFGMVIISSCGLCVFISIVAVVIVLWVIYLRWSIAMLVITWVFSIGWNNCVLKVFWVFFLWMRILIWFFLQVVCLWRRIAVLFVFWVACMRRGIMVVFLISSFFSQWVNIMISSEFLLQPKKYRKVNIE